MVSPNYPDLSLAQALCSPAQRKAKGGGGGSLPKIGWKWQKSGDNVRKGIKKVPFSHVIATFFVFSLVSGEVESSLVGKSGREI